MTELKPVEITCITMNIPVKVLDHGVVVLLDVMGTDKTITDSARISYAAKKENSKPQSSDRDLLRFLMRSQHMTPFEMCEMRFFVKAPIFVFRQWHRHRTASINELSGRYIEIGDDTYTPSKFRLQSKTNKQGSSSESIAHEIGCYDKTFTEHQQLLNKGVAREMARIILPVGVYSEMYWKCDLRNIFHFLGLRMDHAAQWEIRQYANIMAKMVEEKFPLAYEAFEDYALNAVTFTRPELDTINKYNEELGLKGFNPDNGMTRREKKEFLRKVQKLGGAISTAVFEDKGY